MAFIRIENKVNVSQALDSFLYMFNMVLQVGRINDNAVYESSDELKAIKNNVHDPLKLSRNDLQAERASSEHVLWTSEGEGCFVLIFLMNFKAMESVFQVQSGEHSGTLHFLKDAINIRQRVVVIWKQLADMPRIKARTVTSKVAL